MFSLSSCFILDYLYLCIVCPSSPSPFASSSCLQRRIARGFSAKILQKKRAAHPPKRRAIVRQVTRQPKPPIHHLVVHFS